MSRLGSQPAGSRRVAIAKPKNDVYVALLGIALGAVLIACILLAMEMSVYEWKVTAKEAQVSPRPVGTVGALAEATSPADALPDFASGMLTARAT